MVILPILAEEASSLETANEVAALGGPTFDVWKWLQNRHDRIRAGANY